jgi:alkaline phosphatase D
MRDVNQMRDAHDRLLATELSRRRFLGVAAGAGLVLTGCSGKGGKATAPTVTSRPHLPAASFSGPPFTLGVASGDPLPNGVVLWTRLAPEPLEGGGMAAGDVPVEWEVASDERFTDVVKRGTEQARADDAHSVHVDVKGLKAGRWYWYRFRAGREISPAGRTRTAPARNAATNRLGFAFVSCQHWQDGFWTPYAHLAEEDLDVVLFLGDYMYESGVNPSAVRRHNSTEPMDLAGYRNRYGLYKGDVNLQRAHARFPWIVTWDDHEVENNYAGEDNEGGLTPEQFRARRAAAYKAYWEHQPLRLPAPRGPDFGLYRSVGFGDLAEFAVLDGRQYRAPQPCGETTVMSDIGPTCPEASDPGRSMIGADQERWLFQALDRSKARWNVIAQQTVFAKFDVLAGPGELFNFDQWDGYVASRQRILDFLGGRKPSNPVVITGDIHASGAGDLKLNFGDPASPSVGTEFIGTSISSTFPESFIPLVEAAVRETPYAKYFEARRRGYVRCTLDAKEWRSDYRYVSTTKQPEATIETGASFVVNDGSNTVARA